MKDILKELVKLAIVTALIMVAFFGAIGLIALMLEGIEVLPQYIGGLFTFLLYAAVFMLMFAGIKYFADR